MTISLGGYPPFSDNVRDMTMYQQVLAAAYTFPDSHWKDISSEGKTNIPFHACILEHHRIPEEAE